MNQTTLNRATRRTPCPICGAKRWCGIAEDESLAICMHTADGAIKEARNGGYLHILKECDFKPAQNRPVRLKSASLLAHIDRRHAIYEAWLESLSLSSIHANDLEKRGLGDVAIACNLYATIPQSSSHIFKSCAALVERFGCPGGVPGFYPDHNQQWPFLPIVPAS